MAKIYCGSNTGTPDGIARATAWDTLQEAFDDWASGDVIVVEYDHDVGGQTASLTLTNGTGAGALATPMLVYTILWDGTDTYTKATSAAPNIILTNAGADLTINADVNIKGMCFKYHDNLDINAGPQTRFFEDVTLVVGSPGSIIRIGDVDVDGSTKFKNVSVESYQSATLDIKNSADGSFTWDGGVISVNPLSTGLFSPSPSAYSGVHMMGVQFTGTFGAIPMVDTSIAVDAQFHYTFTNCETPSGISYTDGNMGNDNQLIEVIASDDTGKLYRRDKYTYRASLLQEETTVLTTGGFEDADGDVPLSHAITPRAVFEDGARFEGVMLRKYIELVSAPDTATVKIYTADDFTTAPNKNQAFIEVFYLNAAGETLWSLGTSRPADLLATTALDTTAGLWDGTPGHQHYLEKAVTINQSGWIGARVVLEGQDLVADAGSGNAFFYDLEMNVTLS